MAFSAPFYQFFSDAGNGTGLTSQNGNYSVTPKLFYIQPPPNQIFFLTEVVIAIQCATSINQSEYGDGAALTNGIAFQTKTNGVIADPLEGFRFKKNYQWGLFDAPVISTYAGGSQTLLIVGDITRTGHEIVLNGAVSDYLGVVISDDLTGLIDQTITGKGLLYIP